MQTKRKLNVFSGFAREANFCKFSNLPTDLQRFAPLPNWQPPLLQQVCTWYASCEFACVQTWQTRASQEFATDLPTSLQTRKLTFSPRVTYLIWSVFTVLYYLKPIFHLATLFARTNKKVGSLPTFSRRIFSSASFNQSCSRILVFASRRTNKVAKWKIGFILYYLILSIKNNRVTIIRFFASDYFRAMLHNVRYYSN